MRPRAFVIKYMSDLRRREPLNVGVVVTDGERCMSRFLGEDDHGHLKPLNSVPRLFKSRRTYRSWWNHWQRVLGESGTLDPESLPTALVPTSGSNFLCELAAVEMAGARMSLDEFLGQMWAALISIEDGSRADESVEGDLEEIATRLVRPYAMRPGFTFFQDRSIPVRHEGRFGQYFEATLHFHYMIKNGRWNHLRRLKLSGDDTSTWDRVHLAVRQFEGLNESPDDAHREANKIALVQVREGNRDADRQMMELDRHLLVVPVDDETTARESLADIVG